MHEVADLGDDVQFFVQLAAECLGMRLVRIALAAGKLPVVGEVRALGTEREQEALRGIAMGLTNKELAQRMNIAPNTVKTFLRLVMVKMGVARRTGVVAKLLEHI